MYTINDFKLSFKNRKGIIDKEVFTYCINNHLHCHFYSKSLYYFCSNFQDNTNNVQYIKLLLENISLDKLHIKFIAASLFASCKLLKYNFIVELLKINHNIDKYYPNNIISCLLVILKQYNYNGHNDKFIKLLIEHSSGIIYTKDSAIYNLCYAIINNYSTDIVDLLINNYNIMYLRNVRLSFNNKLDCVIVNCNNNIFRHILKYICINYSFVEYIFNKHNDECKKIILLIHN